MARRQTRSLRSLAKSVVAVVTAACSPSQAQQAQTAARAARGVPPAQSAAAKVAPPTGGETEYASLRAAYNALPEKKKAALEGLRAEHSLAHSRQRISSNLVSEAFLKDTPPVEQPLVRTIPATGEKVLLVGSYTTRIIAWPLAAGKALLEELLDWSTQPQFIYRHTWRAHDLVMWDNRLCLHRARPFDSANYPRIMHRTTLAGAQSRIDPQKSCKEEKRGQ